MASMAGSTQTMEASLTSLLIFGLIRRPTTALLFSQAASLFYSWTSRYYVLYMLSASDAQLSLTVRSSRLRASIG